MIKWLRNKIDQYILKRSIDLTFELTDNQKGTLRENSKTLTEIFQAQINSIVGTALVANDEEALRRRNEWISCLNHQINLCRPKKEDDIIIHPITKKKYTKEEWQEYTNSLTNK